MFIDAKRIPKTGHPTIDLAHERLAHVINRAYDQWRNGEAADVYLETLEEFLRMADEHFAEELGIVHQAGYEDWEQHGLIHADLQQNLLNLMADLRADPSKDKVMDAFTMIDRVLYEHEFLDDQEFWDTFQKPEASRAHHEPLIVWSDDFSVRVKEIDRQHKALVKLLNRLHYALEDREPKEEVIAQLGEIGAHTQWHFSYEEKLMEEHDLRGAEAHKMLHESLLGDLTDVVSDFDEGKYDQLEDLLQNYLKYWLLDHITHVDKGLGVTLNKKLAAETEAGENA